MYLPCPRSSSHCHFLYSVEDYVVKDLPGLSPADSAGLKQYAGYVNLAVVSVARSEIVQ